jgi:hypothetical protein
MAESGHYEIVKTLCWERAEAERFEDGQDQYFQARKLDAGRRRVGGTVELDDQLAVN